MGRKPLKKSRRDAPEKKEQWARKLIPHFQKKGLRSSTMDEVARLLHISKATLYKYFSSREEIVALCVAQKLQDIGRFRDILTDKNKPFLERYFQSIEYLSQQLADISSTFLADLKSIFPDTWATVDAFIESALEIILNYYEEGIRIGALQKANPHLMVMTDRFFLMALSDPRFLNASGLSLQEAFRQYFKMKFFGIVKKPEQSSQK
ncbi:MAG: TetR family transcriptional regulator [Chitinophagales bacterium]|nr:MAG: TetR family transcriptional regulator [Chitinophagales bacterium]